MEAYREYLELYEYFGRGGIPRLSRDEFARLEGEWGALAGRIANLSDEERSRLGELKAVLLRDKP